jgi:hypothetical protein
MTSRGGGFTLRRVVGWWGWTCVASEADKMGRGIGELDDVGGWGNAPRG